MAQPLGIRLKDSDGVEYLFHKDDVKAARRLARERINKAALFEPNRKRVDQLACRILIQNGLEQ